METKVQIVLCALLFINLDSAMTDHEPVAHPSSADESPDLSNPEIPHSPTGTPPSSPRLEAAGSDSIPGLDSSSQAGTLPLQGSDASAGSASNTNVSLTTSNDTASDTVELASVTPPVYHPSTAFPPDKQDDNGNQSAMDLSAIPTLPAKVENPTEQSAIEPPPTPSSPISPSLPSPPGTQSAPPQHPPTVATITTQSTVLTAAPDPHNATAPPEAAPHSTPSHTSPRAPSPSSTSPHTPKTHTTTTTTISPVPPVVPTEMTVATTSRLRTTSTSSDSEDAAPSQPPPPPSAETTVYSDPLPKTSTTARPKPAFTPPPAQAHADSVGGDAIVVHEAPTLDPLLAGLVSAFIVTAVIITLLLFLKLRRRDNRPEFRRLQDLPMDDMMEDTPLSMYSY